MIWYKCDIRDIAKLFLYICLINKYIDNSLKMYYILFNLPMMSYHSLSSSWSYAIIFIILWPIGISSVTCKLASGRSVTVGWWGDSEGVDMAVMTTWTLDVCCGFPESVPNTCNI